MFDRSAILIAAWATYRKLYAADLFNRKSFGKCLRNAWAQAKFEAGDAARHPVKIAASAPTGRAAEIQYELEFMSYSERINWSRHADLSAELHRIAA